METMKDLSIALDLKSKTITFDEIILPRRNVNLLQGASTLHMLKLNNSLEIEPKSTLDATKRVQQSTSPVICQRQVQASKCQTSEEVAAASQER
jgi:hypothetical protein